MELIRKVYREGLAAGGDKAGINDTFGVATPGVMRYLTREMRAIIPEEMAAQGPLPQHLRLGHGQHAGVRRRGWDGARLLYQRVRGRGGQCFARGGGREPRGALRRRYGARPVPVEQVFEAGHREGADADPGAQGDRRRECVSEADVHLVGDRHGQGIVDAPRAAEPEAGGNEIEGGLRSRREPRRRADRGEVQGTGDPLHPENIVQARETVERMLHEERTIKVRRKYVTESEFEDILRKMAP